MENYKIKKDINEENNIADENKINELSSKLNLLK